MIKEVWADIKGYEGLYQVSNLGRVKTLDRIVKFKSRWGTIHDRFLKERMCNPCHDSDGYIVTTLSKNGTQKVHKVHRLVAEAFIPNPDNKPCIDHINTIRDDNRICNLRWVTYQENSDNPLSSVKLINKQNSKQVYQYTMDGQLVRIWPSTMECGRNGFKQQNVSACCNNKHNKIGCNKYQGFIWSYTPLS